MAILEELNRRGVARAAAMYVAIAWGGTEILVFLIEALWGEGTAVPARKYLAILFIAGFPVAMYLSWTRDLGLQARRVMAAVSLAAFLLAVLIWLIPGPSLKKNTPELQAIDADPRSIAVLPFVNMSGDEDNTYFSHGISEELLNVLARIPDLKVSSRTSSFHFAGTDVPLKTIAARLGVRHILEGSVRRSNKLVRITAQLIDAKTDAHLWSETYDREILDMFAVQDEIAGEIANKLQLTMADATHNSRPTDSEEAYDNFLRGMHFLQEGWATFLKARDFFEKAIEIDPEYAQAHALLALTYVSLGNFRLLSPKDVQQQADDAAATAIELNNRLPEAWVARGWLAMTYDFDWRNAEKNFRRVIELAPSSYMGYIGLSMALQMAGRYDEALTAARRAYQFDPLNYWTRNMLAEVNCKRREYDAAIEHAEVLLEMQPGDSLVTGWIGWLYSLNSMPAEAMRYADEAIELAGGDPNLELNAAVVYAILGDASQARGILARAEAKTDSQFVSPGLIAIVYANLGDYDQAFASLERAVEVYDSFIFNLGYPILDPIRSDPRFVELCDKLQMACADRWESGNN
jgi:adenylate cyclase